MKKNINEIKGLLLSDKQMKEVKGGWINCYSWCAVPNIWPYVSGGTCTTRGAALCFA